MVAMVSVWIINSANYLLAILYIVSVTVAHANYSSYNAAERQQVCECIFGLLYRVHPLDFVGFIFVLFLLLELLLGY